MDPGNRTQYLAAGSERTVLPSKQSNLEPSQVEGGEKQRGRREMLVAVFMCLSWVVPCCMWVMTVMQLIRALPHIPPGPQPASTVVIMGAPSQGT